MVQHRLVLKISKTTKSYHLKQAELLSCGTILGLHCILTKSSLKAFSMGMFEIQGYSNISQTVDALEKHCLAGN